jgi:hypothetical protein
MQRRSRETPETFDSARLAAVRSIVAALRTAGVPFLKISRARDAIGMVAPGGGRWPASMLYQLVETDPLSSETESSSANSSRPATTSDQKVPSRAVLPRSETAKGITSHAAFKARFTAHVTRALISYGIDGPERLLFMSDSEIKEIPGLGKGALTEIELYREQFLSKGRLPRGFPVRNRR